MPPTLKQTRTASGQLTQYSYQFPQQSPQLQRENHQHPHQSSNHHHQNYHHHQNNSSLQHLQAQSSEGRFNCPYAHCDKSFADLTKFKEHNRSHQSLKPFRCTYGRCSMTSAKKGNLRRHIRQVHKSVRPDDADQYIEKNQAILEAEEALFAAQFCTRKRWNAVGSSSISNTIDIQQLLDSSGGSSGADLSDAFDSSDFGDSSDVLLSSAAELCITTLPITTTPSSSKQVDSLSDSPDSVPPSATAAQFSTILRSATGHYLCPFAGGCSSAFYDVSHLKIHYRVHTALLPYCCTWSPGACRFESTRKGNVVRHIKARHLLDQQQPESVVALDPFDYVKTRTAWIKWEDALFERANVLSFAEYQQQQQQQMSSKKKSSSGARNSISYFTQASTSSGNNKSQRSSVKRKSAVLETEQSGSSYNIDWSSLFSNSQLQQLGS